MSHLQHRDQRCDAAVHVMRGQSSSQRRLADRRAHPKGAARRKSGPTRVENSVRSAANHKLTETGREGGRGRGGGRRAGHVLPGPPGCLSRSQSRGGRGSRPQHCAIRRMATAGSWQGSRFSSTCGHGQHIVHTSGEASTLAQETHLFGRYARSSF
jgi:hypothetical protein